MEITINTPKKEFRAVPFKIAPETFEILKKIKSATNRSYADIFAEMAGGYYAQVLETLRKKRTDPVADKIRNKSNGAGGKKRLQITSKK